MFLAQPSQIWRRGRRRRRLENMTRSHLSKRIQKLEATVSTRAWRDPYSGSFSIALGKISGSDRALLREAVRLQTDAHREVWARWENAMVEATREMGIEGSIDGFDMFV